MTSVPGAGMQGRDQAGQALSCLSQEMCCFPGGDVWAPSKCSTLIPLPPCQGRAGGGMGENL